MIFILALQFFQTLQFEVCNQNSDLTLTVNYGFQYVNQVNSYQINIVFTSQAKPLQIFYLMFLEFDITQSQVSSQFIFDKQTKYILVLQETGFYYSSLALTVSQISNPSTSMNATLLLVYSYSSISNSQINVYIPILDNKVPISFNFMVGTYALDNLQFNFEMNFTELEYTNNQFNNLIIDVEFGHQINNFNVSCNQFIGLSQYQYCLLTNNKIRVLNTDYQHYYNETQQSFIINNLMAPPNLENYTGIFYILDQDLILKQQSFQYSISTISIVDQIIVNSITAQVNEITNLTFIMLSQQYLIANSQIQIIISDDLIILNSFINFLEVSFIQNDKIINLTNINTDQQDNLNLQITLTFQNPEYVKQINFDFFIINISPCLIGNASYQLIPNDYKNFLVKRDSIIQGELTNIYINIELTNSIESGEILIQFPSQMQIDDKLEINLSGNTFSFIYQITNPYILTTSQFNSQAFQDNQLREQLQQIVTLNQQYGVYLDMISIEVKPNTTNTLSTLFISFNNEIDFTFFFIQAQFIDYQFNYKIKCKSGCNIISENIIQITSNNVEITNFFTFRTTQKQIIMFSLYDSIMQISQKQYVMQVQTLTTINNITLTNNKYNQSPTWYFTFIVPQILSTDIIQIIPPKELQQTTNLQCHNDFIDDQFLDCSSGLTLYQMNSEETFMLQVQGILNPSQNLTVTWNFLIIDSIGEQIIQYTSTFNLWEINTIQYSMFYFYNDELEQIKEGYFIIQLQSKIDKIELYGTQQFNCSICTSVNNTLLIIQPNETIQDQQIITVYFETQQNQLQYIFEYDIKTYLNNVIQEIGQLNQVITLICNSSCFNCNIQSNNCTSCQFPLLLYNNICVDECPLQTYYYKDQCNICQIENCQSCGMENGKEICLECKNELFVYQNLCSSINPIQIQNSSSIIKTQIIQQLKIKWTFPYFLLFIVIFSSLNLLLYIKHRHTQIRTLLMIQISLIEQIAGIILFIKFLVDQNQEIYVITLLLILTQIYLQFVYYNTVKEQLQNDSKFKEQKQQSKIIFLISQISIYYCCSIFALFNSQLSSNEIWNQKFDRSQKIYQTFKNRLENYLIYSVLQIAVVINIIFQLQQLNSQYLEIIILSFISIIFNIIHQEKYEQMVKYI